MLAAKPTACRTRSSPWDAPGRLGVRGVPSCSAFSLAPALGSTNSSAGRPASFVRFIATMAESDSSPPCIIGFGSSPSRCGPRNSRAAKVEVSRFPVEELTDMPGSSTTQDRICARVDAHPRFAFRCDNGVGAPIGSFAAQWLAYTRPCRRFAPGLAADDARLGADAVRYSFIAVDLHHLLLAGLPAVAVGTVIAHRPPHRSRRAALSGSSAIAGFRPHRSHRAALPQWALQKGPEAGRSLLPCLVDHGFREGEGSQQLAVGRPVHAALLAAFAERFAPLPDDAVLEHAH